MPSDNRLLKDISKRIDDGRTVLSDAAAEMKTHFVGIDDVIDDIVSKIEMWHVMPELLGRPTIINLWGMTGVGKTDLVRKLVKKLGYGDRYVETMMKSTTSSATIQNELSQSSIEIGQPGVLLIDEIQRFRTISSHGEELSPGGYDDIWTLLSDGKFSVNAQKKAEIYNVLDSMVTTFARRRLEEEKNKEKNDGDNEGVIDPNEPKKMSKAIINRILSDDDDDYDIDEDNMIMDIRTQQVIGVASIGAWEAKRVKSVLNMRESVYDVMAMGEKKIIQLLVDALESPDTYEGDDYTKLLIFVCGNLDEAFTSSMQVQDCDTDADIIREGTNTIDITTIKRALSKRFRPEQIARFGNTHIIYKSLSAQAFSTIIERNLADACSKTAIATGMNVKFEQSAVDMIYRNGVFPLQGTRPLFTTIGSVVGQVMPRSVKVGAGTGMTSVSVRYDDGSKEFSILSPDKEEPLDIFEFHGTIDIIRAKKNEMHNNKRLTAVHEAGHVLVHAALFGIVPKQAMANSVDNEGFVVTDNNDGSPREMMMNMAVGAAGFEAEKLMFGNNLLCGGGATHDLQHITRVAGYFVRRMCVVEECYMMNNDDEQIYHTDIDSTNGKVSNAVKTAKNMAAKIVDEYTACLIELADALFERGVLSTADMHKILQPYLGDLGFYSGDDSSTPYNDMYAAKVASVKESGAVSPKPEGKREKYVKEIQDRILSYKDGDNKWTT